MSDFSSNQSSNDPRIFVGIAVVILLMFVFLFRLFNLQVISGFIYNLKVQNISEQQIKIAAPRGKIFDRNGELLATNIDLFTISITPSEVDNKDLPIVLEKLKKNFDIASSVIDSKVPPKMYNSFLSIELKNGLDLRAISYLAEHVDEYPGVAWYPESKRVYSYSGYGGPGSGVSVGHVVGYVGDISSFELQTLYNQGYRKDAILGKSGIEKIYDSDLKGVDGSQVVVVDAKGRWLKERNKELVKPVKGNDIYLTIDMKIQRLVELALGDKKGSVVVLNASNGEVLAMVSNPVFRVNLFQKKGDMNFGMQSIDPWFPFINRAISSEYPPASTFKVIMESLILETKVVEPSFEVLCKGVMKIGDREFKCHKLDGHGKQNLSDALANSCNIYFATIIKDYLAKDENGQYDPIKLAEYARSFGLGELSGIDLSGERAGLVPDKEWKEKVLRDAWRGGDTVNMSIGQGWVLATPLQIANMMSMIVNDGTLYKPRILKTIVGNNKKILKNSDAVVLKENNLISDTTWNVLKQDLYGVNKGTGWMLNKVVPMAGKTGTGEIGTDGSYHDWYVGYGPYNTKSSKEEDKIVVLVQIEAGNTYEWYSTKVADLVMQGIFAKQNYKEVINTIRPWYVKWPDIIKDEYKLPDFLQIDPNDTLDVISNLEINRKKDVKKGFFNVNNSNVTKDEGKK